MSHLPCCFESDHDRALSPRGRALRLALIAVAGVALYAHLERLANFLTYDLLGLARGSHLGEALAFFFYDTPKVLLLLVGVVYAMGVVRGAFTPERTRRLLARRGAGFAHGLAAALGVVTPFCSCSAVPLFIGFITAGVPLGVTLTFLITAPMVNEIALALLFASFGWKVAGLYLVTGLTVSVSAGWLLGRMKLEKYVEPWVYEIADANEEAGETPLGWSERLDAGAAAVRDIVRKVWPYLVGGIAIGAGIHGYVPADALAGVLGRDAWWSVPAGVLVGVPLYSNAAGIVPVVEALLGKGAALGTTLAFMMATIGLSLPETIILRNVLKPRLIGAFLGVVALGIILVGYLFNAVL